MPMAPPDTDYRGIFFAEPINMRTPWFNLYAISQLKRIRGHNKWINNPQPEQPPVPRDFLSVVQYFGADKNLKVDVGQYREECRRHKDVHDNYWTWKKHRNEARSELEEEFGYDTKHAMHLVRLLRMGREILDEGVVRVKRPDAAELLEIRGGKWTYQQLLDYAQQLDEEIKALYKTTDLPKKVDLEKAAGLLMELQDRCWARDAAKP